MNLSRQEVKPNGTITAREAEKVKREVIDNQKAFGILINPQMSKALGLKVHYAPISQFEAGTREPSLIVVMRHARLARVPMERQLMTK